MKKTIPQLKKLAWKHFSIYIRKKYANHQGYAICVTCGVVKHWKELQAGHFIPGRHNSILFDERGVFPQCLTAESMLRKFDGKYKSIKDIKIGDKLWGFNEETFEKEFCIVRGTNSFLPKDLYEIWLEDGNKFYATSDHKIVANGAWIDIKSAVLRPLSTYDIMEL